MPTTRPRHVITETDEIAKALDQAAKRWPADRDSRTTLLRHLVDEGLRAVIDEQARKSAARRATVARTSGALSGAYGEDFLVELRREWPE